MKSKTFTCVAILLLILFIGNAYTKALKIGDIFDDFVLPTLSEDRNGNGVLDVGEDYNGNGMMDFMNAVYLYDYEGSVVVLDFFIHNKSECILPAKDIQTDIYEHYKTSSGNPAKVPVEVIGINIWGLPMESELEVDSKTYEFLDNTGISFTILMDYYRDVYSKLKPLYWGGPYIVVINGILDDPVYDLWEIIYIESEYEDCENIKNYIDSITPTDVPILKLQTNENTLRLGDELSASIRVKYFGNLKAFDLYIALNAWDQLFFYPNWSINPEPYQLNETNNMDMTLPILKDITISRAFPEGSYSFLSIASEPDKFNPICELVTCDFNVLHQPNFKGLDVYFGENPVYKNPDTGIWPIKIFIENKRNSDITIETWIMELFDLEDTHVLTLDWSAMLSMFNLNDNILPSGDTASLQYSFTRWDYFYGGSIEFTFKGTDENKNPVETISERLYLEQ